MEAGPTLDNLQQEQRGEFTFRVAEDQVFIVNFNGRSDHRLGNAQSRRSEPYDIGFVRHGIATAQAAGTIAVMNSAAVVMVNKRVSDLDDHTTVAEATIYY